MTQSRERLLEAFAEQPRPLPAGHAKVASLVRRTLKDAALTIYDEVPKSPERTLALRKIQEALMHINQALALDAAKPRRK